MRQIPLALAIAALALTAAGFALDAVEFAAGGWVVNDVERFAGANAAEHAIGVVLLCAIALLLLVVLLVLIRAGSRQRAWIIALLLLLPVGYFGWWGLLSLDGGIGLAAVGLVPALVTAAYFVWADDPDLETVTGA